MSWGVATQNGVSVSLASIVSLSCGATEFSPLSLFTSGVQGAWYDPSDYSTLYQDSAVTAPVTAVEQPVGLMLDKSQGLALGSELITPVANQDFSSDTGYWTKSGTTTIGSGKASLSAVPDGTYALIRSGVLTTGKVYTITIDVSDYLTGEVVIRDGAVNHPFQTPSSAASNGTKSVTFLASGTAVGIRTVGITTLSVDNISVKEIAGNHASQATTASRPVLRARYNLLTYSEQFDNAAWTKGGGSTITANSVTAPDGTTTADTLVLTTGSATSQIYQSVAITNGPVTVSVWLRADAPVTLDFGFYDSASDVGSINVTTEWQRFTRTRAGGLTGADRRAAWLYKSSAGGTTVYIWGADLRTGSSAGTYQRIAAATDYATAGFAPYLAFDGVDDFLSAAYVQSAYPLTITAGVNNDATATGGIGIVSVAQADSQYKALRDLSAAATDTSDRNASNLTTASVTVSGNKFALAQFETSLMTHQINGGTAVTFANTNAFGTSVNIFVGKQRPAGLFSPARDYGVVITNTVLTAAEKDSLKNYMAGKMGVTL